MIRYGERRTRKGDYEDEAEAIILDESHRIKSPGGKASRFLYNVAGRELPLAKRLSLPALRLLHSPLDLHG